MSEKTPQKKSVKKRTKLSFQNDFYSDLSYSQMLYALVVRSPTNKGIITSISHPDLPDEYFLITARDVPGKNIIDTPLGKVPVFSEGNISYLGEPLGLLVGPDENVLYDLLSEIEIVFDSNPIEDYLDESLFEPEEKKPRRNSKKTRFVKKEELFSTKIASRIVEFGPFTKGKDKEENLEKIFDKAEIVFENQYTFAFNTIEYKEPNGAICTIKDNNLTVITPTQWISNLRTVLSEVTDIKSDNIQIEKTKTFTEGTNSIWYNSIIASQVAVASLKTGKTVKLVYSRKEHTDFMQNVEPITIEHKTAATAEGKLLAMVIDINVEAGAYNPFAQEIIDRLCLASVSTYAPENLYINAQAYQTSNPPSSVNLGYIDGAAFFAAENQINHIATLASIAPDEIRIKNFNSNSSQKNNFLWNFKFKKAAECLTALVNTSDFKRKYCAYNLDNVIEDSLNDDVLSQKYFLNPLRGLGIACAFGAGGYYGSDVYGNNHYLETTLNEDGTFIIHTIPISPAIQEIWIKTAANLLNISTSSIKINSFFSADEELPLPESVYNNISIMTDLLIKCCEATNKKSASEKLPFSVRKKIAPSKKNEWSNLSFSGTPFHSSSFACCSLELELDPYTYRENIRSIRVIINCGKILSPQSAENSIRLSIQKILAFLVKDDELLCPKISVSFMDSDEKPSQIGDILYNILPAAYTSALSQALKVKINSVPLGTNTIYKSIEQKIQELQYAKEQAYLELQKAAEEAERALEEISKSEAEKTTSESSVNKNKNGGDNNENTSDT